MLRYVFVSVISGVLFGVMDGIIHANPLAARLYAVYRPLAKSKLNIQAGIVIDLTYGFVLAGLFLGLFASLPGEIGLLKGVSFALMVWFLRAVMDVAGQWLMFEIPLATLAYSLVSGLLEMLVLGGLYGWLLKPFT